MPHEVIIHTYSQAQNIHTYSVACFFIVTYLQWFIHISMSSNALHHTMCSGMPPNISMQHSYMWRAMYWGARVQKHPEILCVPANPPSQYYDTCCYRERENITRTSLSKWSCIIFHDDKHEMDHECWLINPASKLIKETKLVIINSFRERLNEILALIAHSRNK